MNYSMRTAALFSLICLGCGNADEAKTDGTMAGTDVRDDAAASSSNSPSAGSTTGSMPSPSDPQGSGESASTPADAVGGAAPPSDSLAGDSPAGDSPAGDSPAGDSALDDSPADAPEAGDSATSAPPVADDSATDDAASVDSADAVVDDAAAGDAPMDDSVSDPSVMDPSVMDPSVMDPSAEMNAMAPSEGSAGCASTAPLSSGTFTLDVGGTERSFVLDVPEDYDAASPHRLVFVWHPLGGSAAQVVRGNYDGLKPLANGEAILVAPDGLLGMAAGISGQGWYNTDGGDIAFLRAMLAHLNENLCVDPARIFSTGFSFGGMMSYAIGCEMADVFRAIAPSSGNSAASGCNQSTDHPVAVLGLHGDADDFVATSGGRSARDLFVERNNCSSTTEPATPEPCVAYQGCDEGYPVLWCEYPGEHRPWSQAPQVIWDFFSQF